MQVENSPSDATAHKPWFSLWLTVGIVGLCYLATLLPVPGLRNQAREWLGSTQHTAVWSIVAFGLAPILAGFWITEVLALLIPAWRRWRIQGHSGRQTLSRIAIGIGFCILLLQVWSSLAFFQHHQLLSTSGVHRVPWKTHTVLVTGFALGTLGLLGLTEIIRRWGLGNGFSVLLAMSLLPDLLRQGYEMHQAMTSGLHSPVTLLIPVLFVALMTYVLWKMFRLQTLPLHVPDRSSLASDTTSSARNTSDSRLRSPLRIPTCGLVPYQDVAVLLSLPATLASWGWISTTWVTSVTPGTWLYLTAVSVFLVVLGVVYSWLFHRISYMMPWLPESLQASDRTATETMLRAQRRRILWMSVIFLLVLFHLYGYIQRHFSWIIPLYAWFVGVAVVMDLWEEWKARCLYGKLVSVWPVHRLYTLPEAVAVLQQAEIPVHMRSLYHRSLLQFFGPFVPVELMVPASHQPEATILLEELYAFRDAERLR